MDAWDEPGGDGLDDEFAEIDAVLARSSRVLSGADVAAKPLIAIDGQLPVRRVEPDPMKLEIFAAEDHRQDWWLERLERCLKLL